MEITKLRWICADVLFHPFLQTILKNDTQTLRVSFATLQWLHGGSRCGWVCAVVLPYWLWTADDTLHYVVSDLLSIILVNVEGENHLSERGFPILPILAHHVLQVDGRWEAGTCKWAEFQNHFLFSEGSNFLHLHKCLCAQVEINIHKYSLTCLANRKLHLFRHDDLKQGRGKVDNFVGLMDTK